MLPQGGGVRGEGGERQHLKIHLMGGGEERRQKEPPGRGGGGWGTGSLLLLLGVCEGEQSSKPSATHRRCLQAGHTAKQHVAD